MQPELVRTQQAERHGERHQVVNDAVGEQRAQQFVGRHGAKQQQQHRLEHADAARHVADDAGGDGDDEHGREGRESDVRVRRQQHEQHAGGAQQVAGRDRDLRERDARARNRDADLAPAQRLVPGAREREVRDHPGEQHAAAADDDGRVQVQHRGRQRRLGQERQAEERRGAQAESERAERDHRRDLFGREPENGVGAQSDRAAAQRIEPDVVADRVAHEGDQGEPRVRHARAGEPQPQGIVQGQAAVARCREDHSPQQLGGLDRAHVLRGCPANGIHRGGDAARTMRSRAGRSRIASSTPGPFELCAEVSSGLSYQGCRDAAQGGRHVSRYRQFDVETARVMHQAPDNKGDRT